MCDPVGKLVEPHAKLAKLIEDEMGVRVSPELVRVFVTEHWTDLSALAHAIHKPETKED